MIRKKIWLLAAVAVAGCLSGWNCNVGMAPSGASSDQMKVQFNSLPLDDKANQLLDVPGPMGDKVKRITQWYKDAGKPIPDAIQKRMGGGGMGAPSQG